MQEAMNEFVGKISRLVNIIMERFVLKILMDEGVMPPVPTEERGQIKERFTMESAAEDGLTTVTVRSKASEMTYILKYKVEIADQQILIKYRATRNGEDITEDLPAVASE